MMHLVYIVNSSTEKNHGRYKILEELTNMLILTVWRPKKAVGRDLFLTKIGEDLLGLMRTPLPE